MLGPSAVTRAATRASFPQGPSGRGTSQSRARGGPHGIPSSVFPALVWPAGSAADALADIDVAGLFGNVADALVGSRTSQSCLWVSTRLGAAVHVYGDRLHGLADTARADAQGCTAIDTDIADAFGTGTP